MSLTKDSEFPRMQLPTGGRVLAVDHDHNSLILLRNTLTQFEVTVADKSNIALELLREKKEEFDLIMVDREMPEIDGFKLLRLMTRETNTPVILMSSNKNLELVGKAVRCGAYFVISKPIDIKGIKDTCLSLITKHRVENLIFQEKQAQAAGPSIIGGFSHQFSSQMSVPHLKSEVKNEDDDSPNKMSVPQLKSQVKNEDDDSPN